MIIGSTAGEHWCNTYPSLWSLGTPYNEGIVVEVGWIRWCISLPSIKSLMTDAPEFIGAVRES